MKGLELSRRYWLEIGLPAFQKGCPQLLEYAAVGLVGEGSDCFGYDDAISRDHDWGPGFCMWLTERDMARWGAQANAVYQGLPTTFLGYRRLRLDALSAGRVGVFELNAFYQRFLGSQVPPQTLTQWQMIPEGSLACAVNGEVFCDPLGTFSQVRRILSAGYPEDVRRKKLAAHCALAAQAGQYNYPRCQKRDDQVAALQALSQFVTHAQSILFLLNRRYRPYYKWAHKALAQLPLLGPELAPVFRCLAQDRGNAQADVERICVCIIGELRRQELSCLDSDYLLDHAKTIQAGIRAPEIISLPLLFH